MDDVKKKVLLDLTSSPVSLGPLTIGICLLMGAWALSSSFIGFLGVCGILAGAAMFIIRLIFQMDKLTAQAQKWRLSSDSKKREIKLDELDNKLCNDLDPRTETALRDLRELHADFKKHIRNGTIKGQIGSIIGDSVDTLFHGCVAQLSQSFEMFKAARTMHGKQRTEISKQRKAIVDDVVKSIEELGMTISKCFKLATHKISDMAQARKELQLTMESVARAEQQTEDIINGNPDYDEDEFLQEVPEE